MTIAFDSSPRSGWTRFLTRSAIALSVAGGSMACSEATAPIETGSLGISISTSGSDLDPDGYLLAVGARGEQSVDSEDSLLLPSLPAGSYTLTLSGLAGNCSLVQPPPFAVTVSPGDTSSVAFAVSCTATTGTLRITMASSGPAVDNDGYQVIIDGVIQRALGRTDSLDQLRLSPGPHTVTITDVALYCSAPGPQTITIEAGALTRLDAATACVDYLDNQIVFARYDYRGWQLHAMNPDGSGFTKLFADQNSQDNQPDINPDGTRIVFVRDSSGYQEIYTADIDGAHAVRLTNTALFTRNGRPTWSPDGSKIAFDTDRDGNYEIYSMDSDGSNLVRLTSDSATDFTVNDFNPVWSPDGTQIVFLRYPDIRLMNADGTGRVNVTNDSASETTPSWSPDGSQLAYVVVDPGGPPWEIFTANVDGSNPTRLTNSDFFEYQPVWSPDGTRLLFVSDRQGRENIYVMNIDGTGAVNLHPEPGTTYRDPVWAFDR